MRKTQVQILFSWFKPSGDPLDMVPLFPQHTHILQPNAYTKLLFILLGMGGKEEYPVSFWLEIPS